MATFKYYCIGYEPTILTSVDETKKNYAQEGTIILFYSMYGPWRGIL
jgi:hypothetical protein